MAASSPLVDRAALSVVFKDPRTLLAFERSLNVAEVAPAAIEQAQADADQALAETALLRAPTYITATPTALLDNERVLGGGTGVSVDLSFPGQALIVVNVPGALGYTPLRPSNNLSDVASVATSRNNLGLGTAAVQNVAFFLQTANNLSDLSNVVTARTNLGLGSLAVLNTVNDGNWSGTDLAIANGGTGASTASAARANLGLGNLAVLNTVGTGEIDNLAVTRPKIAASIVPYAWATILSTGAIGTSQEIASVSKTGTGVYELTLTTPTALGKAIIPSVTGAAAWSAYGETVSSSIVRVRTFNAAAAPADATFYVIVMA